MFVFKASYNDPLDFPGVSNFVNLGLLSLLLSLAKDFSFFFIVFKESSLCFVESLSCHFVSILLTFTLMFSIAYMYYTCIYHHIIFMSRTLRCILLLFWFLFWLVGFWLFFLSHLQGLCWFVSVSTLSSLPITPRISYFSYKMSPFLCTHKDCLCSSPVCNIPLCVICSDYLVVMSCFNLCLPCHSTISPIHFKRRLCWVEQSCLTVIYFQSLKHNTPWFSGF